MEKHGTVIGADSSGIKEFVEREIALRETLNFGDWLRHIRHSHDDLLRLLVGESAEGKIRIDLIKNGPSNGLGIAAIARYELPATCRQIVIDSRVTEVWGFNRNIDAGEPDKIIASLVNQSPYLPVG